MSFIRCTSNPEGLYVFHHVGGLIYFNSVFIPANIFYRFIKLMPHWHRDFKRGSLEISNEFFPSKRKASKVEKMMGLKPGSYKMVFRYKGQVVASMYDVTWKYIYDNALRAAKNPIRKKKSRKPSFVQG